MLSPHTPLHTARHVHHICPLCCCFDIATDQEVIATGDGYAAKSKGSLHNFILITSQGPILRALKKLGKDDGKKAEDIKEDFEDWLTTEDAGVLLNTWLGITDTPSPNTKAWKLLMGVYPHQIWIGCMAHEASLLMKDLVNKISAIKDHFIVSQVLIGTAARARDNWR